MTLQEIFARALEQADEDASAIEERRVLLKQVVNEAYADLFAATQPLSDAEAEVAEDGRIDLTQFVPRCVRVLSVAVDGVSLPFVLEGNEAVRVARGLCTAAIRYRSGACELEKPQDVPQLPERFHGALADYASYCLLGQGGRARQARGDHFLARFLRARAQAGYDNGDSRQANIRNKY